MNIPFKHYKVGGCVRDFVLGKPVNDVDYVVVGATPEDMFKLKFSQVGADFPVFLHPDTKEEYALARTERKSGNGYNGFTCYADPSVTLEEDLARRDFTMNAMAMDENGTIIDPYNGLTDIQSGTMRHVSDAFAEDPLRVLRGARFAARYDFSIAPETRKLMCHLIDTGELDHLTPERIIVEFNKGFETGKPSVMFKLLNDMNAMKHLFPKAASFQDKKLYTLMDSSLSFDEKWAVFVYTSFKDLPTAELQERSREMKIPSASSAFATTLQKLKNVNFEELSASEKVDIWQKLDFRRRPDIAISVLKLKNLIDDSAVNVDYWIELNTALKSVVEQDIAKTCVNKADIQNKITEARIAMCDLTDRKFTNEDLRP